MALSTKSKALLGAVIFFVSLPFILPRGPEPDTKDEPQARAAATRFVELMMTDTWSEAAALVVQGTEEGLMDDLAELHTYIVEHEIELTGGPVFYEDAGPGRHPAFVFPVTGLHRPPNNSAFDGSIEVYLEEHPFGWLAGAMDSFTNHNRVPLCNADYPRQSPSRRSGPSL
jgi:hypothetical protein